MNRPILYIDFNRMIDEDLCLLSSEDAVLDAEGRVTVLHEGLPITVYDDDIDNNGQIDNLVAEGVVERNKITTGPSACVKWCCRIDENGVRHQSEIK